MFIIDNCMKTTANVITNVMPSV